MKHNIFENITTDQQAYWLGFLAADGCCHRNQLEIGLSSKDREHLVKFKEFIDLESDIFDRMTLCSNNGKYYPSSYLFINSNEILEDLANFGIVPNKSHQDIDFLSYIEDKYKKAFIIGYFDGDGWFTHTEKSMDFGFCGCKSLIESIGKYLNEYFQWEIPINIRQDSRSKITFYISSQSKCKIKDFCNWYLSFQNKNVLLQRKEHIAIALLQKLEIYLQKQKQPICKTKVCPICKKEFFITNHPEQIYCSQECVHKSQQKAERPNREQLKNLIRKKSFLSIGEKYEVTDNAIRKWCKAMNLPYKKSDINAYSDEEWALI